MALKRKNSGIILATFFGNPVVDEYQMFDFAVHLRPSGFDGLKFCH
jgi:hypothetical protein